MFVFPRHRDGAAAAIHKHDGLARRTQRLQQILLHRRQFDARAVAAQETDELRSVMEFLALEARS